MRWWHFLRALLGGYFWLPCPICGRNFGGHEKGAGTLMKSLSEGQTTCSKPSCIAEAERRSAALFEANGIRWKVAE